MPCQEELLGCIHCFAVFTEWLRNAVEDLGLSFWLEGVCLWDFGGTTVLWEAQDWSRRWPGFSLMSPHPLPVMPSLFAPWWWAGEEPGVASRPACWILVGCRGVSEIWEEVWGDVMAESDSCLPPVSGMGGETQQGCVPWRRKWQPSPVFLTEKPHGQRSLVGYSPWGRKESDTTEHAPTMCSNYVHWAVSKENVFIVIHWLH